MKSINIKIISIVVSLFLLTPLFSQNTSAMTTVVLVYVDDEEAFEVRDTGGNLIESYLGMEIPKGSSIQTGMTSAELQMSPTGTIIKIANNTLMTINNLQNQDQGSNDFTLKGGKLRAVVARLLGREESYNFFNNSTVCGIRGTDFLLDFEGNLVVADGAVDFTKLATNETLSVTTGMMASGEAEVFATTKLSLTELTQAYESVQFTQLSPLEVPGHKAQEPLIEEETIEPESEAEKETDPSSDGEALMSVLGGALRMEIGSFTVNGVTYSKVLFQPTFQLGKLKTSLYLPVIYDQNLLDPSDWYHPEGNNEWSFGSDQGNTKEIASDLFSDLFLKIRYIEWGQQRDPFYFSFGNYSGKNLGHGILVKNYNNNNDFPTVRKVGLNLGAYGESHDFELIGEDFSNPTGQMMAGRLAFPILGPLSLGFSAAVDLDPTQYLDSDEDGYYIDMKPQFINYALDLDLPVVDTDALAFIAYFDGASMVPIVDGNPKFDFLFGDGDEIISIQNHGASVGLMGNIIMVDFQIEYQYADGIFHHGFYNSTYDTQRGEYAKEVIDYLDTPYTLDPSQGIFGWAGFDLAEILYFSAGYSWPWDEDGADFDNDYLTMDLKLKPDVIPVVGIYGGISYSRTGFAGAIEGGDFTFVDSNTVLKGEVVYPISEFLDLAMVLASAMERDDDGEIIYNSSGETSTTYAVSIDIRMHY